MERHPGDPLFKTGELQTKKLIESDDPIEKMILTLGYIVTRSNGVDWVSNFTRPSPRYLL